MGIDSALLDLTERICHKIQMLTGRTNVWIAFQLTNLSVIVYFIWVALYFPNLPPYWRIAAGLFSGGVLFAREDQHNRQRQERKTQGRVY